MAHFAKIGMNGKVLQVLTLNNSDMLDANGNEDEFVGQQYLEKHNNWSAQMWIQTSYNTSKNKHLLGGTPLRGNFAGIGYTWDEENQIFWQPKPYNSWTKNLTTASWDAPISYPSITDDESEPSIWFYDIYWDENLYQTDNTKGWIGKKSNDTEDPQNVYEWNGSSWTEQ